MLPMTINNQFDICCPLRCEASRMPLPTDLSLRRRGRGRDLSREAYAIPSPMPFCIVASALLFGNGKNARSRKRAAVYGNILHARLICVLSLIRSPHNPLAHSAIAADRVSKAFSPQQQEFPDRPPDIDAGKNNGEKLFECWYPKTQPVY